MKLLKHAATVLFWNFLEEAAVQIG
jgi:hypothetical protein